MFGIGMPELILILAVALIVIGPKKLPDLAKSLGRALGEFKKATSDLKESMEIDNPIPDVKRSFDNLNKDVKKGLYDKVTGGSASEKETSPALQASAEPSPEGSEDEVDSPEIAADSDDTQAGPETPESQDTGVSDLENEEMPDRQILGSGPEEQGPKTKAELEDAELEDAELEDAEVSSDEKDQKTGEA